MLVITIIQRLRSKFSRAAYSSIITCSFFFLSCAQSVPPPAPYGVLPSARQLKWQEMETYAFVHFTINTFTGKEWGYGDEDPALFNPSQFDANQIVQSFKSAGLTGLILTAKHHDGFCLWPTKTTDHNITKSPWKNGKGDMVKEFADACKKYGLKFGVYLSPWDRNNKHYGTYEYVKIYREQYKELLTQYGPIFETWHDGANGGDGYYGGARETRKIDRTTYYGWDTTWALERSLQPDAVIMSDVGWDVRWVGTEAGYSGDPCWHTYTPHPIREGTRPGPGEVLDKEGLNGHRNGEFWMPAETNFSIRPGWFFHEEENSKVKTASQLLHHYFVSVGHGTTMLLNVPPDKRGIVHEIDKASLEGFGKLLNEMYAVNHAQGAKATASNVRGKHKEYAAANVLDDDRYSYWGTDDEVTTGELIVELKGKKEFNVIRLRENIKLGQRIDDWAVDTWQDGQWKQYAKGTAIGASRLIRGEFITSDKIRVRITKAAASICLSEVSIFTEPVQLSTPVISRNQNGEVTIHTLTPVPAIRYTIDGTEPTEQSQIFNQPFPLPDGGTVKAKSFDKQGEKSETAIRAMGLAKNKWKVIATSFTGKSTEASFAIDDNTETFWHTWQEKESRKAPQDITIDMGQLQTIKAFTYLPRQDKREWGLVDKYKFLISTDGVNWSQIISGEFSNVKANPVEQMIALPVPATFRYFRFVAMHTVPTSDGQEYVSVAELGVVK